MYEVSSEVASANLVSFRNIFRKNMFAMQQYKMQTN